jgi:aryl-phospho-beta-D-glucosidase BglC (GH1 family)
MSMERRRFLSTAAGAVACAVYGGSAAAEAPSGLYPDYNTSPVPADATGMASTAAQISGKIRLAINIGNTLEAQGGETGWGNPKITQALVNAYKSAGFDAVRLPCAWDSYADKATARISDAWLERVRTVVQYCMNADLYVVLNIHWDGGWLEKHVDAADKDAVGARQRAFWQQIATRLRDFDERLMFASANEPDASTAAGADILLNYHQIFIDAVRATGGRNACRTLIIQAPQTNIDKAVALWTHAPADPAADRMMLEVHYYDPSQFTIITSDQSWGRMFYYWGKGNHSTIEPGRNATWGEEDYVDRQMRKLKTAFVDKGVPVIVGEFGAYRKTGPLDMAKHNASVVAWNGYVARQALANGASPFYWDTGGLIDRATCAVKDRDVLDALRTAAGKKL